MNDLYEIHCLVLDVLSHWQNGQVPFHLKQSLFVARTTAVQNAKKIERYRHSYEDYWSEIYPIMYNSWDTRSKQLRQFKTTTFDHIALDELIHDAVDVMVSTWQQPWPSCSERTMTI